MNLLLTWFPLPDAGNGEEDGDDEEEAQAPKAPKAPKQLSSKALMELAKEGEEDLVEDLQLSDQED